MGSRPVECATFRPWLETSWWVCMYSVLFPNRISRLPRFFLFELQRKVKQPLTKFRRRRKSACSNVDLQRLVEQFGRCQSCITFLSQSHKLFFADTVLEMLIQHLVILDAHPRHGVGPSLRWIIVTCPDLDVVRQAQKFAAWSKEIVGIATGKVTACSADVHMEEGITAE